MRVFLFRYESLQIDRDPSYKKFKDHFNHSLSAPTKRFFLTYHMKKTSMLAAMVKSIRRDGFPFLIAGSGYVLPTLFHTYPRSLIHLHIEGFDSVAVNEEKGEIVLFAFSNFDKAQKSLMSSKWDLPFETDPIFEMESLNYWLLRADISNHPSLEAIKSSIIELKFLDFNGDIRILHRDEKDFPQKIDDFFSKVSEKTILLKVKLALVPKPQFRSVLRLVVKDEINLVDLEAFYFKHSSVVKSIQMISVPDFRSFESVKTHQITNLFSDDQQIVIRLSSKHQEEFSSALEAAKKLGLKIADINETFSEEFWNFERVLVSSMFRKVMMKVDFRFENEKAISLHRNYLSFNRDQNFSIHDFLTGDSSLYKIINSEIFKSERIKLMVKDLANLKNKSNSDFDFSKSNSIFFEFRNLSPSKNFEKGPMAFHVDFANEVKKFESVSKSESKEE